MSDVLLRQIEMLRLIPQHRTTTAQKIRDQLAALGFETTERTIQRDLNELSRRFPLICEDTERPFKWHWAVSSEEIDFPKIESEIRAGDSISSIPNASSAGNTPMKIFLSYGHDENAKLVERIKSDLEKPENGGHECWFDTSGIKAGDDWRHAITSGIQNSHWVLSFISRHACREWEQYGQRKQGVCLDELAIAIGTRGGIVKTVLVESPTDPDALTPPLTVSHIQYLDMHDWKEKEAEGNDAFDAWYAEKFAEILRVLNDPLNQKFAGDIEFLREKLQPLDNAARIGELMANDFVGREWLRDEIVHWLNHEPQQKVFCLTGEPGFGKSAMAAWLAYQNRPEVIAAHFCQYNQPNFCEPGRVIRSIAFQIATRLPDFRLHLINAIRTLESQPEEDGLSPLNKLRPAELFQTLIADAAYLSIDGGRHRHLVIIDALDEAGKELVEFLAQNQGKLPGWLALFVTSRPNDAGVRQHLNMLNPHYRDVSDARNQADAKAWIGKWLESRHIEGQQQADILEPLLSKSEGNFHYLRTFRHMVEQDPTLLDRPQEYPQGLDSLYLTFFERQFKDIEAYRQWQAPFLTLIAAARRPLPLELAREVLELGKVDWKTRVLQPLGSLFRISGEKDAETIEPFHKSVRDWLKDDSRSGEFFVDEEEGHLKLGQKLWDELCADPEELSDYGISELPYHLLEINNRELKNLIPDESEWRKYREASDKIAEKLTSEQRLRLAEKWLRFIFKIDETTLGKDNVDTAMSMTILANLLTDLWDTSSAEPLFRRVINIREKVLGPSHPDTAIAISNFCDLLYKQERFSDAEILLRKSLANIEGALGPEHQDTAIVLNHLATILSEQGKYEEAERLYRRCLDIHRMSENANSIDSAMFMRNVAGILADQEKYDEAEHYLRLALSIFEQQSNMIDHTTIAMTLNDLSCLLAKLKKFDEAEELLRRALVAVEKIMGADHPDTATILHNLASVCHKAGKESEVEGYYRRAALIRERILGLNHSDTVDTIQNLSKCLRSSGRIVEAESLLRDKTCNS